MVGEIATPEWDTVLNFAAIPNGFSDIDATILVLMDVVNVRLSLPSLWW